MISMSPGILPSLRNSNFLVPVLCAYLLVSCGKSHNEAQSIVSESIESMVCGETQDQFWTSLYKVAEEGKKLPEPDSLREALLLEAQNRGLREKELEDFASHFMEQYGAIKSFTTPLEEKNDSTEVVKALVALETGDVSLPKLEEAQKAITDSQIQMGISKQKIKNICKPQPASSQAEPIEQPFQGIFSIPEKKISSPKKSESFFSRLQKKFPPEIFGAKKTITTAYQSCEVLKLRALSSSDEELAGVKITGAHPGGGQVREVASVTDVAKTHFYLNRVKHISGPQCHNILKDPLIYDFGGKPYATIFNPRSLDLFTNGGSGSRALGVDCSGYIFTALAVGGLKLDPNIEMKSVHVLNIPAHRYISPAKGMGCFEPVTFSRKSTLLPGDIAASPTHVVMIDEVGSDPFGLKAIREVKQCLPERLDGRDFDFIISQSSPSKGGIGINRMRAKDFVMEAESFKSGFQNLALAACRAKFGPPEVFKMAQFGLVRHRKSPACRSKPFTLQKEACLSLCQKI